MKPELQAKVRWVSANFQNEIVALVWVALIYIWFNPDRAVYILKSPWGLAFVLFSVVVSMLVMVWLLARAWRKLTGELKWWGKTINHVKQAALQSMHEMRRQVPPDPDNDSK